MRKSAKHRTFIHPKLSIMKLWEFGNRWRHLESWPRQMWRRALVTWPSGSGRRCQRSYHTTINARRGRCLPAQVLKWCTQNQEHAVSHLKGSLRMHNWVLHEVVGKIIRQALVGNDLGHFNMWYWMKHWRFTLYVLSWYNCLICHPMPVIISINIIIARRNNPLVLR